MKKYLAEFIGTFALVFAGTGAVIVNGESGGVITHIGVALTFASVIACMIYALGNISGAHFNPAVTIAFWVSKHFPAKEIAPYVLSQIAGAFTASAILKFLFPANQLLGTTLPAGEPMQSFVLEVITTFFLMLVIIHVAKGSKEQGMFAGLAIGGTILFNALFSGPISGGSFNPARSLAPAILSGHTEHLWIYLTAPVIGAIIAVLAWKVFRTESK